MINKTIKILKLLEKEKCVILMESYESWEKICKLIAEITGGIEEVNRIIANTGFHHINLLLYGIPILYHKKGIKGLWEKIKDLEHKLDETNVELSFYKRKLKEK